MAGEGQAPDWAALDARARAFVDEAGTPIDPGIQPLVAALWGRGFTTTWSCEGHLFTPDESSEDPAFPSFCAPGVLLEAPAPSPHPLEVLADELVASPALRAQATGWRRANYAQLARLTALLEAFYARRRVPYDVQLHPVTREADQGGAALESVGAQATRVLSRDLQVARLAAYQAELRDFASFLRA